MSNIKAELRLIREKCPKMWKVIRKEYSCPFEIDDELSKDSLYEMGCIYKNHCKECWDDAIESEVKAE